MVVIFESGRAFGGEAEAVYRLYHFYHFFETNYFFSIYFNNYSIKNKSFVKKLVELVRKRRVAVFWQVLELADCFNFRFTSKCPTTFIKS